VVIGSPFVVETKPPGERGVDVELGATMPPT
jgi:hypothetical protein